MRRDGTPGPDRIAQSYASLSARSRPRNRYEAPLRRPGRSYMLLAMTASSHSRLPLLVLVAAPRGFCAGVDRAIRIVELAIERYGAPVYVRHEIVHNAHVVSTLRDKGAVFVETLDHVPDGVPVVFSAHGVPKAVPHKAAQRGLNFVDATCPLVSKVHRQAERHVAAGRHIVFIGHRGHPEVIGTLGQVPEGDMTLVETLADIAALEIENPESLAFLTQTTLSVADTAAMVAALRARFPTIVGPRGEDICYATSNRQEATLALASACDAVLVIGAPNSSNSLRLVEVAERDGVPARLVEGPEGIDFDWLEGVATLGITAGASAPEVLVRGVIDRLATRYDITERTVETARENMVFKLPRELQQTADDKSAAQANQAGSRAA